MSVYEYEDVQAHHCYHVCDQAIGGLFLEEPIACHFCDEETEVDYTLLLTALMEAGLNERKYLVFNSDGSAAISMV